MLPRAYSPHPRCHALAVTGARRSATRPFPRTHFVTHVQIEHSPTPLQLPLLRRQRKSINNVRQILHHPGRGVCVIPSRTVRSRPYDKQEAKVMYRLQVLRLRPRCAHPGDVTELGAEEGVRGTLR